MILGVLFAVCLILPANVISAEDPREEYKKIQEDIEKHRGNIERTAKLEYSILEEIDRTNKALSEIKAELKKYREKRRNTENEMRRVKAEILKNKTRLAKQSDWLKRKLRSMQKYGYSGDVILLLAASEDMTQLMRRWRYVKELAVYDHKMLEDYKATIKNLGKQENKLRSLHAELKTNEEEIGNHELAFTEKKQEKEVLLSSVRKEKDSYEKMLKELKETSKRLLEIIKESEESGTYVARGFQSLKGKLHWPVRGRVIIPYGSQKDPHFNTPVFRNGIYIKAEDDSSAKSVYGGKIVYAEWFKGYGQLVIISHGDGYHTLYANLSEIFYKVGDIIKGQQVIGKVGESGTVNAPGLYFEIRYKGKSLDPTQWLRRR